MNQLKVQAPYHSKNPISEHNLTSQSQQNLLSSSEYYKSNNIDQLLQSSLSSKDKNQLAFNMMNQLQPDSSTEYLEALFSNGVSPNTQDSHDGKSLLMIAAERGLQRVFLMLLRLKASVNLRDNQGKNALFYIIEGKSPDIQLIQELFQREVEVNLKSRSGMTPILTAVERGLVNVVDFLFKKKANPFIKYENTGDTALHLAARRRDKAMFKYLLDYGFDPRRRNKNKQSVRDLCKDQPEFLEMLKDKFLNNEDGMPDHRKGFFGATQNDYRPTEDGNYRKKGEYNKGEAGKSNRYSNNYNKSRENQSENLENGHVMQDHKTLPVNMPGNRNDDNCSNASTSYSNGHSEINFHTKHHNPPLTLTSHYSDDPSKYPDKPSGQFSNNLQVHNPKRENSGVSRTSITSAQSDMVSDNESMSTHSQSNLAQNSYMQQLSPEMQDKSKIGGSMGSAEYFNNGNGQQNFNREYARSQSYMNTSGGENAPNGFNKQQQLKLQQQQQQQQQRKYKNQGSLKGPYSNGSYNDYPSPNFNSNPDGPMNSVQGNNNNMYFNNRSPTHENMNHGKINLINNGMMNENNPGSPNLMYSSPGYQNQGYNNYNGDMPPPPPSQMMNYRNNQQSQPQPQFFFNPQHGYMPNDMMNKMFMGGDMNYNGGGNNMMQDYENQPRDDNQHYKMQQQDHFTHHVQQENMGLRDKLSNTMKQSKEYQADLENAKQESKNLKNLIDDTNLSTKNLEQLLKEKEELIQELIRKNSSLEESIKQVDPDFLYDGLHCKGCSTDSMLTNFVHASMQDIIFNENSYRPFPKSEDVTKRLDQEIRDFEKAVDRYVEGKQQAYDQLQELITVTLADEMPEAECTIYGSFATGLWLPWSDIDIVIKIPQIENALNVLHILEARFKEEGWVSETKAIKNTTVPLLKVVCSEEFMKQKLDITIKDFRHNELSCVNMIKEYIALYPPLRPVTLVVKDILNSINLNNTYLGGLSSYGILLMAVYLLQTKEMERSKNPKEEQNLGEMLLSFLHCFGLEYDYYTNYIVNPQKILTNGETHNDMMNEMKLRNMIGQAQPSVQQPRIIIQDPVSIQNNVGKSTFRIIEIKNAFIASYFEAYKPCTCEVHDFIEGLEGGEHECGSILKKMYIASQSGQIFQNFQNKQ